MRTCQNTSKPQQHLNMADPATIVLGGEAPSINVDFAASYELTVVPPQSKISVDVASTDVQSIQVGGNSLSISLPEQRQFVATTVNTETISVEVSNRVQALGSTVKRLRDLEDVIGDPESGQILFYNSGQNNFQFRDNQGAGSGESDENINEAIEVTNTDPAFSSIVGQTFETGTSITSVLSDILNPYTKATVSRPTLTGKKNQVAFVYGSNTNVEVGTSVEISQVSYTISDPDKVKDSSVNLVRNGSPAGSSLAASVSNTVTLPNTISSQKIIPGTDSYKMSLTDNGNPNNIEYTIDSSPLSINWMYRVRLAAHSTEVTDNATASTMFLDTVDDVLMNDPGSSTFDLDCSNSNSVDGKYTYIVIPESFGTLSSVLQNGSTDVTADFSLVGSSTFTVQNSNGVSVAYYIYRTNDTGAFNDGITLNVKLN